MRRIIGTAVSALIVLALLAAALTAGGRALTELEKETLLILLAVCGCSAAFCFFVGEATRNFSQMDKLWSLLPIVYTWIVAARGGMKLRLVVYALIVTAWGIRLTVNFARKGAYRLKFWEGEEDYRWSVVRGSRFFRRRFAWVLFDLFFISVYQNLLVLAIILPALASMESAVPFGAWDAAATVAALLFLALETVADEVQWRFHRTKKRLLAEGKTLTELPRPYDLGFNTRGPWGYMRHPNYLGEQGMWFSLYFFAVGAGVTSLSVFHWTMAGPLLLILLFMGSSALGERISSGKYPAYAGYIDRVYKYLPLRKFDPGRDEEIKPV